MKTNEIFFCLFRMQYNLDFSFSCWPINKITLTKNYRNKQKKKIKEPSSLPQINLFSLQEKNIRTSKQKVIIIFLKGKNRQKMMKRYTYNFLCVFI